MENLRFSVWKLHLSLRSAKPHQLYCRRHHSSSSQPHRTTTTLTNLIKIAVVSLLLINCQCESRTTVQNSEQSSNSFVNSKTEIRDPNFIKSKLNTTGNGLISRALQEERLEDAVRLFLEEWETLHGIRASNKTTARTKVKVRDQDTEMQADHPIVSPPTWASNGTSVDRNTLIAAAIQRSREMISDSDTLPTEDDEEDETDSNHHELQQTPQQRNCSRCMMQEEARQRRLQEIKVDILNKLGLKHVPNVTTKSLPEIPPLYHLREKFGILNDNPRLSTSSGLTSGAREEDEMSSDQPAFVYSGSIPPNDREEEFEEFYVNTERAISLAQKPPETWKIPKEFRAQYFKLTAKVVNSHVNKAHLWAHITPSERNYFEPNKNIVLAWVVVYQIVKGKEGDSPTLMEVKKKKFEVEKEGGWVQIDVKKLVTHWSRKPNENRGLVMHCYDSQGHELMITGPENGMDQTKRTFIEIQVETKSQNRKRRLIGLNCDQNSKEVRCCRNPLTVDFEEFGWDWIIAPKRYEANYCSGECPFVFLQKYPHTHLVQQANPSGSTGPCCAPRKMSSISMLYFDDNYNIIHGMLPGMVVDRCSCS